MRGLARHALLPPCPQTHRKRLLSVVPFTEKEEKEEEQEPEQEGAAEEEDVQPIAGKDRVKSTRKELCVNSNSMRSFFHKESSLQDYASKESSLHGYGHKEPSSYDYADSKRETINMNLERDKELKKIELEAALDRLDYGSCLLPSYISLLKACIQLKSLALAKRIHASLIQQHVDICGPLGEYLVMTMSKCGGLDDAISLFHLLPYPTVFSWTSIITALADEGDCQEALQTYFYMQEGGITPDSYTFVTLFKACGNSADLESGKLLHHEACGASFDVYAHVGNTLVSMYGRCMAVEDGEGVFFKLRFRNEVSWNALLSAYIENGEGMKALLAFRQLMEEGLRPSKQALIMAVQACGLIKGISLASDFSVEDLPIGIGQALHAECRQKGFATDVFVGTTLVSMYGTCGSIQQAANAFGALPLRNTVSWNAMMCAYIDQDKEEGAFHAYRYMLEEGVVPDQQSFLIILQACGSFANKVEAPITDKISMKVVSFEMCRAIHMDAERQGCVSHHFVENTLISVYGKCGAISEAESIFCELRLRSIVSWTAMLSAYIDQQQGEKALQLYRQLRQEGLHQNYQTTLLALQACGLVAEREEAKEGNRGLVKVSALQIGQGLHAEAQRTGFTSNSFIGNTLISMYGKIGAILEALNAFVSLDHHNVVSWTAILSACVEKGEGQIALQLFREMHSENVRPDHQTFVGAFQACAMLTEKRDDICVQVGKALHADALKRGFLSNPFVSSALLCMYSECGTLCEAENTFSELTERTHLSWIAMLSSYINHCQGEKALQLYRQFKEGLCVNQQVFVMALQACGVLLEKKETSNMVKQSVKRMTLEIGHSLHAECKKNIPSYNAYSGSTLVFLYGKCGAIIDAENVFCNLPQRSVVSWNVMMVAYLEQGYGRKALQLYTEMQREGILPNQQTSMAALQACGILADQKEISSVEASDICHALHMDALVENNALDPFLSNTLVHTYGDCGFIEDAEKVFYGLSRDDIVSWNTMMMAYVKQNQWEKALDLYTELQSGLQSMNDVTLLALLEASSKAGSLERCRELHFSVVSVEQEWSLTSSLMYAYESCSSLLDAKAIFNVLSQPDLAAWSSHISGYARGGDCMGTWATVEEMQSVGIKPDELTLNSVLFACSHGGMVDAGVEYVEYICRDCEITLDMKHYVALVDLVGRAGNFKNISNFLHEMSIQADPSTWPCLLSACCKHGNVKLGKKVFEHAVKMELKDPTIYVLMSNIMLET